MKTEISEELTKFMSDLMGLYEKDITPNARLQEDLSIYGDDAVEFIIAYGKKFNVNVSNFMLADYFDGEGSNIMSFIDKLVTGKLKERNKTLRVINLQKGIELGKLDEETITQA